MAQIDILVPVLGESVAEATIGNWLKKPGDVVSPGEPVADLETDKINLQVFPAQAGVLASILKQEGDTVIMGDIIGTISADVATTLTAAAPALASTNGNESTARTVRTTPVAARIAQSLAIDPALVPATGSGGRVTKEDVRLYAAQPAPPPAQEIRQASVPTLPAAAPTILYAADIDTRREERVHMTRRRQTIARRLVEAQHTAAMLTTFNDIDMSAVMEVRKRRRDSFKERHGIGLGFMSFFTKAVVGALKTMPRLNAEIQGDDVILKHYYDIGIAVGAEEGLVVPVLRDADRKSFADIEHEIAALAKKARDNTLALADLQGGTFTITNGGVFGSLLSTPILNTPQVGILGMHKIQERPIAVSGQVVIRPMMYLALSYDHRIVDGREAVQFLVRIKDMIEDPETLLLEG